MARASARTAADGGELTERLLDAAAQVLAEQGLGELTVRRVAERADSSTMGVYSRFGGRTGILEALYRRLFGELARALRAVPVSADPLADVRALAVAYRAFALAGPQRYAFMFADPLPAFAPGSDLRAETVQTTFAPLLAAVGRTRSGAGQVTRATYCLWCVMHGLIGLEFTEVLRTRLDEWNVSGEDEAAAERMFHAGIDAMIAGLEL
ncbi:MAG TPA: TetR/AcrR family transcriptional regulator [Actinocrinis sp.]|nr:TetR/AcrR family transcriptional regulator [Actinocrinis sp.]